MSNTPNANSAAYFDLHTSGVGYLSRIREVPVKKGPAYLACTIGALRGSGDSPEYTYFDCNVVGEEANRVVRQCMKAVEANKKVLVGFRVGDLAPEIFTYTKGDIAGKPGVSLKARLLKVMFVSVDGERKYDAPPAEAKQSEKVDLPKAETPASDASAPAEPQKLKSQKSEAKSVGSADASVAKAEAAEPESFCV